MTIFPLYYEEIKKTAIEKEKLILHSLKKIKIYENIPPTSLFWYSGDNNLIYP
jgi:hypothetical protein